MIGAGRHQNGSLSALSKRGDRIPAQAWTWITERRRSDSIVANANHPVIIRAACGGLRVER